MWFKLALGKWCHPLSVLVGRDGHLYWRILDIALVLGKSNTYDFSKRVKDSLRGCQVVPTGPDATLRCLVLPTSQTLELLAKRNSELANALDQALLNGKAVATYPATTTTTCSASYRIAPLLTVDEERGNVLISEWIRTYAANVLQLFQWLDSTVDGGGCLHQEAPDQDVYNCPMTVDDNHHPRVKQEEDILVEPQHLFVQSELIPETELVIPRNREDWVLRIINRKYPPPENLWLNCDGTSHKFVRQIKEE